LSAGVDSSIEVPPRPTRPRPIRAAIRGWSGLALLLAILVAVAAVGLALAWTLRDDQEARRPGEPARVESADLRAVARSTGHPVYWAGRSAGDSYELTERRRGAIHVRYLPEGTPVGDRRPAFLTVSTYPYPRAYALTSASAEQRGMAGRPAPAGGIAAWSRRRPTNVYLAYPGSDVLVEVFHPDPEQARQLATTGDVGPIR
jgi:hypothetical protein